MKTIFVIIVTYNGMKWYKRCFESLFNSQLKLNIIVVDNASSDNTVDYINSSFNTIHVIENASNIGFAKANNLGIQYAMAHDADYVFLLNQDAWIEPDTISELIDTFERNPNAGVVSPIHLNGSHTALDRRFAAHVGLPPDSYPLEKGTPHYLEPLFVNAAAWLISRKCLETVGGFDTSLFIHYGEDDNYCQRLRYHHFSLIVSTKAFICHDREQRDGIYDCNRTIWSDVLKQEEFAEKFSDINQPIRLRSIIVRYRLVMFITCLMLNFKKASQKKQQLLVLKKVAFSRNQNKRKGPNWI